MRKLAVSALLFIISCSGGAEAPNLPPVASLAADAPGGQILLGQEVTFDASGSYDPDGFIQQYRFVFADGSPQIATASPGAGHAFAQGGSYEVTLIVVDDDGAEGRATVTISVLDEPPPQPCFDDGDCRSDERCQAGTCVPAEACSMSMCESPLVCVDDTCRCPGGLAQCGAQCVNLSGDLANCGECGRVCGPEAIACEGGECVFPPGCDFPLVMCGDVCVDVQNDENNCGDCFRPCDAIETCQFGNCVGPCPPDAPTFCPESGTCVDTTSDPNNCGGCGIGCMGFCVGSMCQTDPPGTVIEIYPAPPYTVIRGMTQLDGTFYLTTGRRFVQWEPTTGDLIGEWFINNEPTRRCYGLSSTLSSDGTTRLYTGAYNRFGDPLDDVALEEYPPYGMLTSSQGGGTGGATATDGVNLYVFYNQTRELITFDAFSLTELSRETISGFAMGDTFTDMALDGYGGMWLVRPEVSGPPGPLMKKFDIASATVTLEIDPPGSEGLGGIVLVGGQLWGVGADGTYVMIP